VDWFYAGKRPHFLDMRLHPSQRREGTLFELYD